MLARAMERMRPSAGCLASFRTCRGGACVTRASGAGTHAWRHSHADWSVAEVRGRRAIDCAVSQQRTLRRLYQGNMHYQTPVMQRVACMVLGASTCSRAVRALAAAAYTSRRQRAATFAPSLWTCLQELEHDTPSACSGLAHIVWLGLSKVLLTSARPRGSTRPSPSGSALSASMAAACIASRAPTSRLSVDGTAAHAMLTAMRSSSATSTSSHACGPSKKASAWLASCAAPRHGLAVSELLHYPVCTSCRVPSCMH